MFVFLKSLLILSIKIRFRRATDVILWTYLIKKTRPRFCLISPYYLIQYEVVMNDARRSRTGHCNNFINVEGKPVDDVPLNILGNSDLETAIAKTLLI